IRDFHVTGVQTCALPIFCEPFALICDRVTEAWRPGLEARQAIARRIAEDYGAVFVAFQALFDAMTRDAPPQYWLPDGVHPSPGRSEERRVGQESTCHGAY